MDQVNKKALELRNRFTPSQITAMFPVSMQVKIIAACPTVDCCAEIPSPKLCVLSEAYPEGKTKSGEVVENTALTWMKGQMLAVSVFAGVKEKMSDFQIKEVCEQILAENPTLTMVEFILFCARLRSGKYEDFYGVVDPMKIIKSLDTFLKDKSRDISSKWEREEEERKNKEAEEHKRNAISYEEWLRRMEQQGKKPQYNMGDEKTCK